MSSRWRTKEDDGWYMWDDLSDPRRRKSPDPRPGSAPQRAAVEISTDWLARVSFRGEITLCRQRTDRPPQCIARVSRCCPLLLSHSVHCFELVSWTFQSIARTNNRLIINCLAHLGRLRLSAATVTPSSDVHPTTALRGTSSPTLRELLPLQTSSTVKERPQAKL